MTQMHMHCIRSETILLRRLDLKSHFSDCFLTIRAYFEFILRDPGAAMFKLRSWLKILDCYAGKYFSGSLFNLGVCKFSGLDFGGCVIISNIGYKNKKDFSCSHAEDRRRGRIMFKESFLSPKSEQEIRIQ